MILSFSGWCESCRNLENVSPVTQGVLIQVTIGVAVQGLLPQTCEIFECLCPTSPLLLYPFPTIPHCYPLTAQPCGLEYLRKRQELESRAFQSSTKASEDRLVFTTFWDTDDSDYSNRLEPGVCGSLYILCSSDHHRMRLKQKPCSWNLGILKEF